jgi:hypothetical protein
MEGKEIAQSATRTAGKLLGSAGHNISRLMPRGGIRHPDSLITQGSNRSLYIPGNGFVSPVPGARPVLGKGLLTGGPRRKKYDDGLDHLRRLR